jgi:hypothetical protein
MIYPKPVVRMFAEIVSAVSAKLLPVLQTAVPEIVEINYQFGHLKELIATMKEYESSANFRTKKYPLVALLMDFPEQMGDAGGYIGDVTLTIIIAHWTLPTLKAADRYTNNFEPILLPIYHELLRQIEASPYFITQSVNKIRHTKTDHPYWGKGGLSDTQGNVFADYVDAIEISNLSLRINFSQFQTILTKL